LSGTIAACTQGAPSLSPIVDATPTSSVASPVCNGREAPTWVTNVTNPNDGKPDPAGRILFGAYVRNDAVDQIIAPLFAVDPDGSDLAQLMDCEISRPRFSRDGRRLVFGLPMSDGSWQLATAAADGRGLHILTSQRGVAKTPDWSPDGTWLVYAQDLRLWRVNADGTDPHLIGDPNNYDWEPRLSPDGTKVVFTRAERSGVWEPWIRDLATGRERPVLTDNTRDLEHPDWSRDGHSIIYNTLHDAAGQESEQIERMPADDPAQVPEVLYRDPPHFAFKPAYSPDGLRIVFGLDGQVFLMDADGSLVTLLVTVQDLELNHFDWGVVSP
jgi:Tol biopolymer transport system component